MEEERRDTEGALGGRGQRVSARRPDIVCCHPSPLPRVDDYPQVPFPTLASPLESPLDLMLVSSRNTLPPPLAGAAPIFPGMGERLGREGWAERSQLPLLAKRDRALGNLRTPWGMQMCIRWIRANPGSLPGEGNA